MRKSKSATGHKNSTQGYIKSPNYPNNYDNDLKCSWKIEINERFRISIKVLDVSIENR